MRAKLWGKAQRYLSDALADKLVEKSPDLARACLRQLGLVYEAIGDAGKAAAQFRAAALVGA